MDGITKFFRREPRSAELMWRQWIERARWRLAPTPPKPWQISHFPEIDNGFDTTIGVGDLHEGCRRLGVVATDEPNYSYTRTAIGTMAVAPDGARSWVKVSALAGSATHWQREGELCLVTNVPKPKLIASCEWVAGEQHWLALQMMLASSPAVESGHWAGARACAVSDTWIAELKEALSIVGQLPTQRVRTTPDEVATTVKRHFGPNAPSVAPDWRVAHGDMHWSNITAPQLTLFDWQLWGHAPRGFDAACLIAASCWYPTLARRLERAFIDDLATPSGRVAQLFALGLFLDSIDAGRFNPRYRVTLKHAASRVIRD